MGQRQLLVLLVVGVFILGVVPTPVSYSASVATTVKTTNPSGFGLDVGPAKWSFGATKFSWASGSSNMTLNLPSLVVNVAGTNCNPAFTSSFSKNASFYTWTLTAGSALLCNGASITPVVKLMVGNTTSYNRKEVFVSVKTTKLVASGSSVTNSLSLGFVSPTAVSVCNSAGTAIPCTAQCFGTVCLDWGLIAASSSYTNSTHSLTSTCSASASQTVSCTFDPLAIDGHSGCAGSTVQTSCTYNIVTTNTNDMIVVGVYSVSGLIDDGCVGNTCITVTNGASLTQNIRWKTATSGNGNCSAGGGNGRCIEYCMVWSSSGTLSITLTKTTSGSGFSSVGFGISGVSSPSCSTGYDNGATYVSTGATSPPTVTGVTFSNQPDMAFGFTFVAVNSYAGAAGTLGADTMTALDHQGASGAQSIADEELLTSKTYSSVSMTFTTSSSTNTWVMIADAIRGVSVTQPVKITLQEAGAPTETLSVTLCTTTTIVDDGAAHNLLGCAPSGSIVITVQADATHSRYRFCGDRLSHLCDTNAVAVATWTFTACASGTCSEQDNNTYYQLSQNYTATPQTPTTWDAAYSSLAITGTFLGTSKTITTFATTQGGGAVTTNAVFADYNLAVAMPSPIGNSWYAQAPFSFTDTTANHVHNVNYVQGTGGPDNFIWLLLIPLVLTMFLVVRKAK